MGCGEFRAVADRPGEEDFSASVKVLRNPNDATDGTDDTDKRIRIKNCL